MHGMMKMIYSVKDFYNEINGATLTGAIDVIAVEQPDGTFNCSPFHVRFGKLGVLRSREKVVDIEINGEPQDIHMKLGESGEAFFVEELDDENDIPEHLATSPIPVEFENLFKNSGRRRSLDLDQDLPNFENEVNDYAKRRNTADNESNRTRERKFLQRQIGLGNIDVLENSAEDMTLSIHSAKMSSEDISKSNDISDTIFKMDSLEMDVSKTEETPMQAPIKSEEVNGQESKSSKKKRKKMKRKNAARKSSSVNQISASMASSTADPPEKTSESATDRSSMDSNSSEPELHKIEKDAVNKTDAPPDSSNIKKLDADFHFFSDTELTTSNNADSRCGTPVHIETVQSDSEFEVNVRKEGISENSKSWEWGGFPSMTQTTSPTSEDPSKGEQKSMMSSMFSFMKQKRHPQVGMYLSDISSEGINPQIAELYFNKGKDDKQTDADMDCESGNGPSLTQSPNSAEGCKSIDSDFEEQHKSTQIDSRDISLSLCGWDPEPTEEKFMENVVKFADLCNNPVLFENSNLVIRIKDKYYTWKVAAPIIASIMIYGRPLLQSSVDQLVSVHMPNTARAKEEGRKQESKSSWWSWGRNRTSRETTPAMETSTDAKTAETKDKSVEEELTKVVVVPKSEATSPIDTNSPQKEENSFPNSPPVLSDKYRKTLRLSSKQIASLNLKDGANEVEFSVTTAYQGTTRCQCHLYKWKWDDKIVISDIDGTITKSDVLGHILPIVGKDWAQSGVAQLFNKIKGNGYKLLYLSARAIGQARITREYLRSIKQGDLNMPDGPVLLNPTSLLTAFHREVIEKKPEQFKISCMSDIKALFPADSNPFYAGYGNRINDVWAYTAVGIPIVRIFTINPKGELKHELTQTFQSSYSNMSFIVDQLFPPVLQAANDYSQFIYWREPITAIEELPELAEK